MADVVPPIRDERVLETDPITGNPVFTLRWSEYLDEIGTTLNETTTVIEQNETIVMQGQQVLALQSELSKALNAIDSLITSAQISNARLSNMQKQIDCLNQLIG